MRIAREAHLVPAARERVEEQQPAGERLADAGHQLDRLHRLDRADDAHQRREHAHRRAALLLGLGVLGEQAVVAGRLGAAQVEHRDLPVEADARARDQRLARRHARAVERVARGEVVGAVEHHVGVAHERGEALGPGALLERLDADLGIDRRAASRRPRRPWACRSTRCAMHDLALQVGEVDAVAVADGDAAHAARGEVEQRRGAEAARADHERVGGEEALLRFLAELVQQQVAAVAQALAGRPRRATAAPRRPRLLRDRRGRGGDAAGPSGG